MSFAQGARSRGEGVDLGHSPEGKKLFRPNFPRLAGKWRDKTAPQPPHPRAGPSYARRWPEGRGPSLESAWQAVSLQGPCSNRPLLMDLPRWSDGGSPPRGHWESLPSASASTFDAWETPGPQPTGPGECPSQAQTPLHRGGAAPAPEKLEQGSCPGHVPGRAGV